MSVVDSSGNGFYPIEATIRHMVTVKGANGRHTSTLVGSDPSKKGTMTKGLASRAASRLNALDRD